eukprot:Rmarinus@m.11871
MVQSAISVSLELLSKTHKRVAIGEQKANSLRLKYDNAGLSVGNGINQSVPSNVDAFYVVDLGKVVHQYERWISNLPRVKPYYAVKCNPDRGILQTLAELGAGFDCASKAELQAVLDLDGPCGTPDILYANPIKMCNHLKFATKNGVDIMTFDSEDELIKISMHAPNAKLVLRLYTTDESMSLCPLGHKFGASLDSCAKLFTKAKELGLSVVGVSFHVGSGCLESTAFLEAVRIARKAFDIAKSACDIDLELLDIGGGWPGCEDDPLVFEDVAAGVGPLIDDLFPSHVNVIAEPGRYFACQSHTLVTRVISSHHPNYTLRGTRGPEETGEDQLSSYMLSEGVYGAFKDSLLLGVSFVPETVVAQTTELLPSRLRGPTDEPLDVISPRVMLPRLARGDCLVFRNMGAYTRSVASHNVICGTPTVLYILADC